MSAGPVLLPSAVLRQAPGPETSAAAILGDAGCHTEQVPSVTGLRTGFLKTRTRDLGLVERFLCAVSENENMASVAPAVHRERYRDFSHRPAALRS